MQREPTRQCVCMQNDPGTSSPFREGLPPAPAPPNPLTPPAAPEDPQKAEEEQRKTLRKTRRSRIKELEDTRLVKGSGFRVQGSGTEVYMHHTQQAACSFIMHGDRTVLHQSPASFAQVESMQLILQPCCHANLGTLQHGLTITDGIGA